MFTPSRLENPTLTPTGARTRDPSGYCNGVQVGSRAAHSVLSFFALVRGATARPSPCLSGDISVAHGPCFPYAFTQAVLGPGRRYKRISRKKSQFFRRWLLPKGRRMERTDGPVGLAKSSGSHVAASSSSKTPQIRPRAGAYGTASAIQNISAPSPVTEISFTTTDTSKLIYRGSLGE
ncbi:hypothetical protein MAPG_02566, partial [Magnaporthiopsis poae ATCC 64411]|uniref:Uncharacterized protein n=1 Tax=Magnaporthiopsis poae (strain ATCC 64411 / 73-15) TaxID=644358 RepID=A0A0C4DRQ1_MAGP6